MQTFMPYLNQIDTANCLDNKRLGKQRVEAIQIASCLLEKETRWKNHPCVKMWRGYERYLIDIYLWFIMGEWIRRGFKNKKCYEHYYRLKELVYNKPLQKPCWLTEDFCKKHREILLKKNYEYYKQYFIDNQELL